jgi:hypothetical protein
MRVSPFSVAEEALGQSSAMRGLQGMEITASPKGPNMFDGGPASKVTENTQPFNNARLEQQNVIQNTGAAVPQAEANAVQQSRKMSLVEDNQAYKANELFNQRKEELMYVMNTPATAALGNMSPPEEQVFRNHIAVGKAQSMGVNPDLVQNKLSEQNYG